MPLYFAGPPSWNSDCKELYLGKMITPASCFFRRTHIQNIEPGLFCIKQAQAPPPSCFKWLSGWCRATVKLANQFYHHILPQGWLAKQNSCDTHDLKTIWKRDSVVVVKLSYVIAFFCIIDPTNRPGGKITGIELYNIFRWHTYHMEGWVHSCLTQIQPTRTEWTVAYYLGYSAFLDMCPWYSPLVA